MKAETLKQIRKALARLDEGRCGYCDECGEEIVEPRLRALPFAVRCKGSRRIVSNTWCSNSPRASLPMAPSIG